MSLQFVVVFAVIVVIFISKTLKIVPQQQAWVRERLGRFHDVLEPGLRIVVPFIDRIAYKHNLKEIPLDVPSQICITRDNTQLQVDGILYFQVRDPKLASYGASDYVLAITQLAQTTLRSVIGKLELDRTFEEREDINRAVVLSLDEAAANWGVKVLRYEIKDLTPPQEILHAMQKQITAEREKRALIAQSEGVKQQQINLASGQREAAIQKSQGDMQAAINQSEGEKQAAINRATGEAQAIRLVAHATAEAVETVGKSIETGGGIEAVNLKVAERYIDAFGKIAKEGNTMLLPGNVGDVAGVVATAMSIVKASK